jgi:hypothetical protein
MVLASLMPLRAGRSKVVLGGAALAGNINAIDIASAWQTKRGEEQGRTGVSGRLCGIRIELVMDLPYRMGRQVETGFPDSPAPGALPTIQSHVLRSSSFL